MSRIGKKPIEVPAKVKVNLGAEGAVTVEGPRGKLSWNLPRAVSARLEGSSVLLDRSGESRQIKALHGLSRALVANMVAGVTEGFKKELEIHGVGFRAAVQGQKLNLSLGKSHPIPFQIPPNVKITVADGTKITIEGVDKHLVGQTAADIRAFYPPEPYKGKGVRYLGEQVRRKAGKTVQ
jgi:large subunit ribosomal protein L6